VLTIDDDIVIPRYGLLSDRYDKTNGGCC
jgi:hypothetical protein